MLKKTIRTVLITVVSLLAVEFILYVTIIKPQQDQNLLFAGKLSEIRNLIDENAIMDFDSEQAEHNAISSYVSTLDDAYCYYFDTNEYSNYLYEQEGNFTGIGVSVQTQSPKISGDLLILRVIGNSPAEKADLRALDRITKVDGKSVDGEKYADVINSILGKEDTDVVLTIKREDTESDYTITRSAFVQKEVDYRIINGNLGFIRIYEFNTNAYSEFEAALNSLLSSGVEGFIFDIRNNPGGEFNTVKKMVDLLVAEDELVVLKYKNTEKVFKSTANRKTDLPMVVLLNSNSASASELFASALRDLNSTPLVGVKSFGKGIGQTSYKLGDGSGLKFTTFKYMTKSRTDYNGIGLAPDYEIALSEEDAVKFYTLDETNDKQLQKAIEILDLST